ncbi:MAG: hypothetical protein ACI4SS_05170, partial [Clostridia bacterium]
MDFEQPIKVRYGQRRKTAVKIAREIIDKYELKILKQYIRRLSLPEEDAEQVLLLSAELLNPSDSDEVL